MGNFLHSGLGLRAAAWYTCFGLVALLSSCGGGYGGGGGGSAGAAACGSGYSNACPPPTVAVTAPAAGATVSGSVTLTATATASSTYGLTISQVAFMVDGTTVATATASPYSAMWNSTSVANGSHSLTARATDSMGDTATSSAVEITVQNPAAAAAAMTAGQIFPAPMSGASGMAHLVVKLESGAVSGRVTLTGLAATSVAIHAGFAGASGPALIGLTPSPGAELAGADEWEVPAGALLTAEQLAAFSQGRLYVMAASAAHPRGEIRGQLVPENVVVTFSALAPAAHAQAVGAGAGGVIATTVDRRNRTLSVHINSTGVDDSDAAEVVSAASGQRLATLTKDSVEMGHWSTELTPVSAAELARFESGQWFASIATAVDAQGALEGQIRAPSD
jgi:CHRD domain/Bacterial Ig domain